MRSSSIRVLRSSVLLVSAVFLPVVAVFLDWFSDTVPPQLFRSDATGQPASRTTQLPPQKVAVPAPPRLRKEPMWSSQRMENRLHELGAKFYLLEKWGQDGSLYRFHCKMIVSDDPSHTRHFEATEARPGEAIAKVLRQVEVWRSTKHR